MNNTTRKYISLAVLWQRVEVEVVLTGIKNTPSDHHSSCRAYNTTLHFTYKLNSSVTYLKIGKVSRSGYLGSSRQQNYRVMRCNGEGKSRKQGYIFLHLKNQNHIFCYIFFRPDWFPGLGLHACNIIFSFGRDVNKEKYNIKVEIRVFCSQQIASVGENETISRADKGIQLKQLETCRRMSQFKLYNHCNIISGTRMVVVVLLC